MVDMVGNMDGHIELKEIDFVVTNKRGHRTKSSIRKYQQNIYTEKRDKYHHRKRLVFETQRPKSNHTDYLQRIRLVE